MEKLREEVGWQAAVCLNGQLEIQLPEGFEVPSNDVVERTFPYGQKPQEIYADSTGEKIITFNVLQNVLEEKQVYIAIREVQRMIGHLYPESIRRCARCIHILFILPMNGKMMLGSYHFPEGDEAEETEVFLKIIRNIVVKKKTQEKAGGWYVGGSIW